MYNPMTCGGWGGASSWIASGSCLSGRIGFVLLFFIIAFMRKWIFGLTGVPYNFILSMVGGMVGYLIMLILVGSFKWALLIGLVAAIVLGIFGVSFAGETDNT